VVLDSAASQLVRLGRFVDRFAGCFGPRARPGAALQYVQGLLSDAPRKNMEGAWSRSLGDSDYQAIHNLITHSKWSADSVWRHLRGLLPDRKGVLIIDDTGFAKQGTHSVGVARQYSGTLGKVGNCQVAVSCALRTDRSTWALAMDLYLPEEWANDEERRDSASIPNDVVFKKKWEIALAQVDRVRADGVGISCVVSDAGYGDCTEFRDALDARGLPYCVAVKGDAKVFLAEPEARPTERGQMGRPKTRRRLAKGSVQPVVIRELVEKPGRIKWRPVTWRRGAKGQLTGQFAALRVIPAHRWRAGQLHKPCWLILERCEDGAKHKFYLSNLPENAKLRSLVGFAHTRWAIEQQYQQLKEELGLDHFEGRSYPGFHHHAVLTALAYTFLQLERRRARSESLPTLPEVRRRLTELIMVRLFVEGEELSQMAIKLILDRQRRAPPKSH